MVLATYKFISSVISIVIIACVVSSWVHVQFHVVPSLKAKLITSPEDIAKVLKRTPPWTQMPNLSAKQCHAVMKPLLSLADLDTQQIRKGVKKYLDSLGQRRGHPSDLSCVLILNRVIFNVPNVAPIEQPLFGGWFGRPHSKTTFNPLWPLRKGSDGRLVIYARDQGYNGPSYAALEEFDYFDRTYGRRPLTMKK